MFDKADARFVFRFELKRIFSEDTHDARCGTLHAVEQANGGGLAAAAGADHAEDLSARQVDV
jgi:hypothetical protein